MAVLSGEVAEGEVWSHTMVGNCRFAGAILQHMDDEYMTGMNLRRMECDGVDESFILIHRHYFSA